MQLPEYMIQLFEYNDWANEGMLAVAAGLGSERLTQQQGHSWGSVHGVLVHMMSAEWIWLRRWQGESPGAVLNPREFPTLEALRQHWSEIRSEMRSFVAGQTTTSLQRAVSYTNTRGQMYTLPLWQLMAHLANHGTHHRGELAAMYAMMDAVHPEEDLYIYFLSKSGQIKS